MKRLYSTVPVKLQNFEILQKMKKCCEENEDIQFFLSTFKVPHDCLTLYHTIPTFNDPEKEGLENIVGKRENAGYQHFLLFPQ